MFRKLGVIEKLKVAINFARLNNVALTMTKGMLLLENALHFRHHLWWIRETHAVGAGNL